MRGLVVRRSFKVQFLCCSAALLIFFLQSCIVSSPLDTGKTIDKNTSQIGGYLQFAPGGSTDFLEKGMRPIIGLMYNYGLLKNYNIGLGLNSISDLALGQKLQLLRSQSFNMSIGAQVGTNLLFTMEKSNYFLDIPIYTSYHFTSNIALCYMPSYYTYKGFSDRNLDKVDEPLVHNQNRDYFFLHTIGMVYGKKCPISIYVTLNNYDSSVIQYGVSARILLSDYLKAVQELFYGTGN